MRLDEHEVARILITIWAFCVLVIEANRLTN